MTTPPAPIPSLDALADELSQLLDAYTQRYEQLMAFVRAHRDAIRRADGAGVEAAAAGEAAALDSIAGLDQRRNTLVNAAAAAIPTLQARPGPITLSSIAAALPGPASSDLRGRAARLRTLARDVADLNRSVAGATASVLSHIEGLMRHVGRALSHAGTYSPRGCVDPGPAVVSSLDLRT